MNNSLATNQTKPSLWSIYKGLTRTDNRISYSTATKATLNYLIEKKNKFNELKQWFADNVIPAISNRTVQQITPEISLYLIRHEDDKPVIIETIHKPLIIHYGNLPTDLNRRKTKIYEIIDIYIDSIRGDSGTIYIVKTGIEPILDYSDEGITKNNEYRTLLLDTEYTLNTIRNDEIILNEYDDLELRGSETLKLYSVGLNNDDIQDIEGECVLNGIMHNYKDEMKNITRTSILSEMGITRDIKNQVRIAIKNIKDWCRLKDVSLYLVGINNRVMYKYISTSRNYKGLFIKVANDHSYLIDDDELKEKLINCSSIVTYIDWKSAIITVLAGNLRDIYNSMVGLVDVETKTDVTNVIIITDVFNTEIDNINNLAIYIAEQENLAVENLILDKYGNIEGFTYKNVWVLINKKYHDIIAVLDEVKKIETVTNKKMFNFYNQAIQSITKDLLQQHNGNVPKSNLSVSVYKLFTMFNKGGYNDTLDQLVNKNNCKTYDIAKCHSAIISSRLHSWGIFTPFDEFLPYEGNTIVEGAKYTINKPFNLGQIKMASGIYDSEFVENCINANLLKHSDLSKQMIPTKVLSNNFFKDIVELLYKLIPKYAKDMINLFIGSMGSHHDNHCNGEISTSKKEKEIWLKQNTLYDTSYRVNTLQNDGETFLLYKCAESVKIETNLTIYHSIIDMSKWALYQLCLKVAGPQSKIMNFKTDSITVQHPNENVIGSFVNEQYEQVNDVFDTKTIGYIRLDRLNDNGNDTRIEDCINRSLQKRMLISNETLEQAREHYDLMFDDDDEKLYEDELKQEQLILEQVKNNYNKKLSELKKSNIIIIEPHENNLIVEIPDIVNQCWQERKTNDIEDLITRNRSFGLFGKPGRGKTYTAHMIKEIIEKQNKKVIATSLAHQAVNNLKNHNIHSCVIKSLFSLKKGQSEVSKLKELKIKYDYIIVDEYTICGQKDIETFYKLYKIGVKIIFIGDYHQLAPIDTHRKLNYRKSYMFMEMCNFNYIELTKNHRFDKRLDDVITKVYDEGILENLMNRFDKKDCFYNISYTNKTSIMVNKKFSDKNKNMDSVLINNWYCVKGSPIICKFNKIKDGFFNNKSFILNDWDDKNYYLNCDDDNDEQVIQISKELAERKTKNGDFNIELGHCMTCHSAQGSTLKGDVRIWDLNHRRMTREFLYTAMSRATALKHVFINCDKQIIDIQHEKYDNICGTPWMMNRKKAFPGVIYELLDKKTNEPFYVGSFSKTRTIEEIELYHIKLSQPLKKNMVEGDDVYTYIRKNNTKFKINIIEIFYYDIMEELEYKESEIINQYYKYGEDIFNDRKIEKPKKRKLKEGKIIKKEDTKAKGYIRDDIKNNKIVFIYYVSGKRLNKAVRYGKKITKKDAMTKITDFQKQLYV